MENTMKITDIWGDKVEVTLEKTKYYNGNLAIQLWCEDGPYAMLTVNLPGKRQKNEAYVDVNNCPWAEDFIRENTLGEPLGRLASSGFCVYPLYRFYE